MGKEIITITSDDLKDISGKEYMKIMSVVDLIREIRDRKDAKNITEV